MKILIPPSEGKSRVKATGPFFSDTNFKFKRHVNQVVRLLELIDDEDLRSVYGTSTEKALGFHRQNQDIFNSSCAPAIERYTGVVYEHIDWMSLSEKAKKGRLTIDDLQGGTFTITNGGIYGSMLSTPIINPPQSGIMGMHNIVERPVIKNGSVVARPIMYLALSYDHRIIDGKEAVSFLKCVKECLEEPRRLFLDL